MKSVHKLIRGLTAAGLLLCSTALAQVDSDGDLNADVTDPFPNDPNQGGVYAGAVITYDVLMAGDLDATGFTGTVITITANGVTFDGNGHKVIATDASQGIAIRRSQEVTLTNVEIRAPNTTGLYLSEVTQSTISGVTSIGPGGRGISLWGCSNNIVENCTLSGRLLGILITAGSNNIIRNNDCSQSGYAIQQSGGAGNRFLNNNCSESRIGLNAFDPAEVIGNLITNCTYTGLILRSSSDARIFHNNIFDNRLNVSSDQPIELSFNGEGNFWGRSCPGPLFVPGEDSNSPDVVDSHPYASFNGWLDGDGGWPGCALQVVIDIKPGDDDNPVNLKSKGVIPVAILTTDGFDATTVDPLSVAFGPAGAMEAHGKGHIEDVDGDGDLDMMLHFKTKETGIACGDTEAGLTGETIDNDAITGTDVIQTIGCGRNKIAVSEDVPKSYALYGNYPNPFNPETQIRFALPDAEYVTLKVYNIMGHEVRTLAKGHYGAGYHAIRWDGKDEKGIAVPSGVYLYRLTAGDFSQVRKMSLLR